MDSGLIEFASQWDIESIPACDEGLALLRSFADAQPSAYQLALQRGFTDLTHPVFASSPKWAAFVSHRNTCEKCNEV